MNAVAVVLPPSEDSLQLVVQALARGELCIIPTDTVYGVAAQVAPDPVARLYRVKGRPEGRPIPLLVSDIEAARALATEWTFEVDKLARTFWPGALTLVVPAVPGLPQEVTAGTGTVGVRWPACPLAESVIERSGGVLAVTSANRSGEPPAASVEDAFRALGTSVPYILDGGSLGGGLPSTVVRVVGKEIEVIREGAIAPEAIRRALDSLHQSDHP